MTFDGCGALGASNHNEHSGDGTVSDLGTHNVFTVPSLGARGIIVDCSKPANCPVNNFVSEVNTTFSYHGVDDLIRGYGSICL